MYQIEAVTRKAFDCMDERRLLALLKKNLRLQKFEVELRGKQAEKVITAKLPGGGLGLVRAVEIYGKKTRLEAFEMVEGVCGEMGFEPMVHVDNHHGEEEIEKMSDSELIDFVANYFDGCGFAKLAWGDQSAEVVKTAMDRGWLIGVLGGKHGAKKAVRIERADEAVDRAMSQADAFSFNVPETQLALAKLGEILGDTAFANVAFGWLDDTFAAVSMQLGNGISQVETVQ